MCKITLNLLSVAAIPLHFIVCLILYVCVVKQITGANNRMNLIWTLTRVARKRLPMLGLTNGRVNKSKSSALEATSRHSLSRYPS